MNNWLIQHIIPSKSRALKEAVLALLIQFLVMGNNDALFARKALEEPLSPASAATISVADILARSQVSYRAEGGFTGVQSFSVLISCIDGQVSFLKSIHDPRSQDPNSTLRQIGSMEQQEYVALWDILLKCRIFNIQDAAEPTADLLDEFTYNFEVSVGEDHHEFRIVAMSRPEAARYFAIKNVLDKVVNMSALWKDHREFVKNNYLQH